MKNILIIDMQKGFINKNNSFLIEKINDYLALNNFENIFYTKYINTPQSPFVKILNWNGMLTVEDQKIVVNQLPNSMCFVKTGYGLTTEMISKIKEKNITEIEICGTDTDACVLAIAYNLFDNNIKPIIIKDLCSSSSTNKLIHKNSLEIMKRSFGEKNII